MTVYLTTQELCNAVYATVKAAEEPITRKEIAERIGHSKAPHINAMIEHLASTGWIWKYARANKFGQMQFVYWMPYEECEGTPCQEYQKQEDN